MPKVILVGDIGTDQGIVIKGSSTVTINNRQVARVGDLLKTQSNSSYPPQLTQIATGSATVFVDGKSIALEGSKVDSGAVLIATNSSIIID